jgi:hypothetical protein
MKEVWVAELRSDDKDTPTLVAQASSWRELLQKIIDLPLPVSSNLYGEMTAMAAVLEISFRGDVTLN